MTEIKVLCVMLFRDLSTIKAQAKQHPFQCTQWPNSLNYFHSVISSQNTDWYVALGIINMFWDYNNDNCPPLVLSLSKFTFTMYVGLLFWKRETLQSQSQLHQFVFYALLNNDSLELNRMQNAGCRICVQIIHFLGATSKKHNVWGGGYLLLIYRVYWEIWQIWRNK